MLKPRFLLVALLVYARLVAQEIPFTVDLNHYGKDERFEKYMLTMPVFLAMTDTVLTLDFEDLRPAIKIAIKKPAGYNTYGYSYLFFTGNRNLRNPGYTNLLVGGIYDEHPHLFIDRNNNFDFTDDGEKLILPTRKTDSLVFKLYRNDDSAAAIAIKLKRVDYSSQPAYRKMMNEYYSFFYKDRELAGIDYSYREQRYITKCGVVRFNNDSFRIALYDGNSNGIYNDPDSDRVVTANISDTLFDSKDELRAFTVSKGKMYVEYNSEQFEITDIDKAGRFIRLVHVADDLLLGRTKPGKKIPKFKFRTWNGEIKKIKKLRQYNVYLYFTGPSVKGFSNDTMMLRKIADAYPDKLKVIAFLDVNKSYELKIFGTYSNLNYDAAYREREIISKLSLRGLPTSVWLGKRRRVIEYNIKPGDFLKAFERSLK